MEYAEIVYRVEDCEGRGPYVNQMQAVDWHNHCLLHPSPKNDIGINGSPKELEYCAFESLEALNSWFSESELQALHKEGITVQVCQGRITARGKKQCLFIPDWQLTANSKKPKKNCLQ